MTYRHYPLEKKIEFLDAYQELGSITSAAIQAAVQANTSRYWIRKEKQLREAYTRSKSIKSPASEYSAKNTKRSLEEKLECIKEVEQGLSYRKIAHRHTCSKSSVLSWYKRRDTLLVLYYTEHDALEVEADFRDLAPTPIGAGGDEVPKDEITQDLTKKIKTQAKEIKHLKDEITFLENLNKILQERTGPIKKRTLQSD